MYKHISTQAQKLYQLSVTSAPTNTKLVTFTSGKGGVGKSTFTANIAYLLAKKGLKVCVMDADIGLANLQVLLNVKPNKTLFDYIDGTCGIDDILIETEYENLVLIAGKSGHQYSNIANSYLFSRVVNDVLVLNRFDVMIIDTGAGLNDYVQEFLEMSKNIFAITSTDPSALTDVYALIKMLSEMKKQDVMICFNHTKSYEIGQTISNSLAALAKKNQISKDFMIKYLGNVSTSTNIQTVARMRKLFVREFPNDVSSSELGLVVDLIMKNLK